MSEVKPLHPVTTQPPRPLRDTLETVSSGEAVSPWLPRPTSDQAASGKPAPSVSLEALESRAREQGRAAGLAETAELRRRLADAVARFEMVTAEMVSVSSAQIADAVVAAIGAWTEREDRARLFAPAVQAWAASGRAGRAAAHVHPGEVAALQAAVGEELELDVVPDAAVKPGNLVIRSEALELATEWDKRLADLRERIVAVLEHEQAEETP